mgnify:CR=1 FL=1
MSLPPTNRIADVSTVTVTVAGQTLLSANERRRYASISNSGANGLWLGFGAAAVVGSGVYVPPNGGQYIIEGENRWKGSVTGIVAAATSVVGMLELK